MKDKQLTFLPNAVGRQPKRQKRLLLLRNDEEYSSVPFSVHPMIVSIKLVEGDMINYLHF